MTRDELVELTMTKLRAEHGEHAALPTGIVELIADMIELTLANDGIAPPPPVQVIATHTRRYIGQPGERACSGSGKPPTPTGVCPVCYQRTAVEIACDPGPGVRHG